MKKILLFVLIIFICCKSGQSGTTYLLDQNEIIIKGSNELKIESIVNGIDPIFEKQGLNVILNKTYSEYFKKDNFPSIWILPTEINLEKIEEKVYEKYEVLGQAKTGDETSDKSLTYNFMVEFDSIPHSLIFNIKAIKNKTYTIYFKSISGESSKMRDGYFDFMSDLK